MQYADLLPFASALLQRFQPNSLSLFPPFLMINTVLIGFTAIHKCVGG